MAKHNKIPFSELMELVCLEQQKKLNLSMECIVFGTKIPRYIYKDWHYSKLMKKQYGKG